MSALCGVCSDNPSKYKCPTCQLLYCSIPCFKSHKITEHSSTIISDTAPVPESNAPVAILPPTLQAGDFSTLADHPSMQTLLSAHPTLRDDLRRIYAATLAPNPSQEQDQQERRSAGAHRGYRGRGRGFGHRGRGRGRGGRDVAPWTPKQGEKDALYMLRAVRQGSWNGDTEGVKQFVKIVGETYGGTIVSENEAQEEGD